MTDILSIERLKHLLTYDPNTGIFKRRVSVRGAKLGKPVGHVHKTLGYLTIGIDRRVYLGHRLAWFYMTGRWPVDEIDHRNCIRHDNRWTNLRQATSTQNKQNRIVPSRTLPRGVSLFPIALRDQLAKPYCSRIRVGGKRKFLGYFETPELAHDAYVTAAQKYHGEFARTQ